MGSTDNFLPGTVLSPVASAAATVPEIEVVEVAEIKAAEAGTEDVFPFLEGFAFFPTAEATEVGTKVEDVSTEDDEVWTDDIEVETNGGEVEMDDEEEESGTSIEEVDAFAG